MRTSLANQACWCRGYLLGWETPLPTVHRTELPPQVKLITCDSIRLNSQLYKLHGLWNPWTPREEGKSEVFFQLCYNELAPEPLPLVSDIVRCVETISSVVDYNDYISVCVINYSTTVISKHLATFEFDSWNCYLDRCGKAGSTELFRINISFENETIFIHIIDTLYHSIAYMSVRLVNKMTGNVTQSSSSFMGHYLVCSTRPLTWFGSYTDTNSAKRADELEVLAA
jgi:hypothetical protein